MELDSSFRPPQMRFCGGHISFSGWYNFKKRDYERGTVIAVKTKKVMSKFVRK